MTAEYNPPYDSPIEDRFAYYFVKYAHNETKVHPQHPVSTICRRFVLDFMLVSPEGLRAGIECDGREFHDASRDEWRDAMIIGDNQIDVIYRLRGRDINYYIEDILFVMQKLEPCLFKERSSDNLGAVCSDEVRAARIDPAQSTHKVHYQNGTDIGFIQLGATRRQIVTDGRVFWSTIYEFATDAGGGDLDAQMVKFRKQLKPVKAR